MIFDCFNFFNELDILELRLNILYDYVDYFVIVESSVTHSGHDKPFYFEDNKSRYEKFLDKIIHYKVIDTPTNFFDIHSDDKVLSDIFNFIKTTNRFNIHNQPDYGRDFFQKECVKRALVNCKDDDIIIISDADEIPNPLVLSDIKVGDDIIALHQPTYYYYINLLKQSNWYGSRISKYGTIKNLSLNEVRGSTESTNYKVIENGGWHFSFMGGVDMVKKKLLSYSARDMVNINIISSVENNIINNIDPFFRSKLKVVHIDNTYPEYIINNIDKYKNMMK